MEIGVKQAAELLNVSDKTISRWLSGGQIPFYRVGSQYRFSRSELLRWATATPAEAGEEAAEAAPVSLEQSLRAGGIFYRIGGKDVRGVLEQLLALMRLPAGADTARILELLHEREQVAPTAVGEGIAFPHCRDIVLPGLASPMVALGFLETPVDFSALDKQPVSTLFLFLSPSAQSSIRTMARLAHAIRQPTFSALLRRVAMREELYAELAALDRNFAKG